MSKGRNLLDHPRVTLPVDAIPFTTVQMVVLALLCIPPTAAHLKELTDRYKGKKGAILYTEYQPGQGPDFLSRNLGWPKVRLPLDPPVGASAEEYLQLIDRWVDGVASGK